MQLLEFFQKHGYVEQPKQPEIKHGLLKKNTFIKLQVDSDFIKKKKVIESPKEEVKEAPLEEEEKPKEREKTRRRQHKVP